jgi:hypothetical protein
VPIAISYQPSAINHQPGVHDSLGGFSAVR